MKRINLNKTNMVRVAVGVGFLASWAYMIGTNRPDAASRDAAVQAAPADGEQAKVEERHAEQAERLETAIASAVSAVPTVKNDEAEKAVAPLPAKESPSFGFATELFSYSKLRSKVLLTDDARAQKEGLLRNVDLLKSLESLLKSTSIDARTQEMQNAAIDMLLEARASLASGAAGAAELVLRSVIEDKQVESEGTAPDARRTLAGVKAEVLYQWSAQDPTRASDMRAWLPGPVSQKIWANVVEAQNQNEIASSEAKQ